MLTRKPKVGETLIYKKPGRSEKYFEVLGFNPKNKFIMYIRDLMFLTVSDVLWYDNSNKKYNNDFTIKE